MLADGHLVRQPAKVEGQLGQLVAALVRVVQLRWQPRGRPSADAHDRRAAARRLLSLRGSFPVPVEIGLPFLASFSIAFGVSFLTSAVP